MKKINNVNISNKEIEKLKFENKKLKEEFEKYKEITYEKLKNFEFLNSQYEKTRRENEDLKKKLSKSPSNINPTNQNSNPSSQNYTIKTPIKLKNDSLIKILTKQREILVSVITKIATNSKSSKQNSDVIMSYLDDDVNDKDKIINQIYGIINKDTKKKFPDLTIKNFNFEINPKSYKKRVLEDNQGENNEKEIELIKKINDMLSKIQKRKEYLKNQKNSLSIKLDNGNDEK